MQVRDGDDPIDAKPRTLGEPDAAIVAFERPVPEELNALFVALGWGQHSLDDLASSIRAYTTTICARTADGRLVGYASVFSDGVLTTMFGEFVVHPEFQRHGIGRAMMLAVERQFPSAPIYAKPLGASRDFYAAIGFRTARVPFVLMFKHPGVAAAVPESMKPN